MPRNSVVVFDEAHNIDNICIDSMSVKEPNYFDDLSIVLLWLNSAALVWGLSSLFYIFVRYANSIVTEIFIFCCCCLTSNYSSKSTWLIEEIFILKLVLRTAASFIMTTGLLL